MTISIIREEVLSNFREGSRDNFSPTIQSFFENLKPKASPYFTGISLLNYSDKLLNTVKDDVVFVTCFSPYDIYFIKILLEGGKRVVVGGSLIFICSDSEKRIRDILTDVMGVDAKIVEKNLMIIRGYVDLHTDLHKLVKQWGDTVIEDYPDVESIWECNEDYLASPIFLHFMKKRWNQACFSFSDICWWGKCKFCNYKKLMKINYYKDVKEEKIVDHITTMMGKYQMDELKFIDNYFQFTDKAKRILDAIPQYKLSIFTGVPFLKRADFIDNINKYNIDMILLGMESVNDFSLKMISKGYRFNDIQEAFTMMKNRMKRNINLATMLILDLPSKNRDEIDENFNKIVNMKADMFNEGFYRFNYSIGLLQINPGINEIVDGKYIRLTDGPSEQSSGESYLTHLIRETGFVGHLPDGLNLHFERFDEDGNHLPTDLKLIDHEKLRYIFLEEGKENENTYKTGSYG